MKTLVAATPNCLVYDDGEALGNRSSTLGILLLPFTLEWAPGRGGIVLRGRRISVSHLWKLSRVLGQSYGYIAGCYGLEEAPVREAVEFGDLHPEVIEPECDGCDRKFWLDP